MGAATDTHLERGLCIYSRHDSEPDALQGGCHALLDFFDTAVHVDDGAPVCVGHRRALRGCMRSVIIGTSVRMRHFSMRLNADGRPR